MDSCNRNGQVVSATRVRQSDLPDLKEFDGRKRDVPKAKAWFGKVKAAFQAEQSKEMHDVLTGPAVVTAYGEEFCGGDVSPCNEYYHARQKSNDEPLAYLYRLNVAAKITANILRI